MARSTVAVTVQSLPLSTFWFSDVLHGPHQPGSVLLRRRTARV